MKEKKKSHEGNRIGQSLCEEERRKEARERERGEKEGWKIREMELGYLECADDLRHQSFALGEEKELKSLEVRGGGLGAGWEWVEV